MTVVIPIVVPVRATSVECPTCGAWVGWACEGRDYGYHAAGYHVARTKLARELLKSLAATKPRAEIDELRDVISRETIAANKKVK